MLVFAPYNEEFIISTQKLVHRSLEKWAGDLIKVEAVEVKAREGLLEVSISYILHRSGKLCTEVFSVDR